ncbi:MAG: tRNA lysidine(34) synthetase TilS [Rhodobacteraceae bacterium]|nr:tRNA lysidine(34) synthetase TilS [Paracoccaceae bacterium]
MSQIAPASLRALGLAVSGGGDSMALMRLAQGWAGPRGVQLAVATVDHGLRAEAAAEAALVAKRAAALGLPHQILRWQGWSGSGNLQDAARQARKRLLSGWARAGRLDAVVLGHTLDDQAETLLMRLARGSGVEGLAAMAPCDQSHGMLWLRPMLGVPRAALRDYLRALSEYWVEDPSNHDTGFDRIKARQALAHLAPLGLGAARLAETADRMQQARDSLDYLAAQSAASGLRREHGDYLFDAAFLDALPTDTRNRLVARVLCVISGSGYRPRLRALMDALHARRTTLHGCLMTRNATTLRITREYNAVASCRTPVGEQWDGRWRLTPPPDASGAIETAQMQIRALGPDGLRHCGPKDDRLLPRASLLASPALWHDDTLIAAPLAGLARGWRAQPCEDWPFSPPAAIPAARL